MDTNSVLRSGATDLTADETLTDYELLPQIHPMYLHVMVPAAGGTSPTLDITADFENTSGTTLQQTTIPQISAAGHYVGVVFCDHPDMTDLSVILNVGGTTPDFGAVKVYLSTSRVS